MEADSLIRNLKANIQINASIRASLSFVGNVPLVLSFVLSPHNQVRVSGEFAKQVGGGGAGINANPVFGRKVERAPNAVVAGLEFFNAVRLALERDNAVIVAIEKGEHMAVHVKHQHTRTVRKSREWHLFNNIGTKRKTKVAICLDVRHYNTKIEIFGQRCGRQLHNLFFPDNDSKIIYQPPDFKLLILWGYHIFGSDFKICRL